MRAMRMGFQDRAEAGRQLAKLLVRMADEHPVVVAVARGGVPVACEVAHALSAPLDVVVVRRLTFHDAHGHQVVASLGEDGSVLRDPTRGPAELSAEEEAALSAARALEEPEVHRRALLYRKGAAPLPLEGRTVILVDDGLGSGTTQRAAIEVVRRRNPARLVLAVPVGSIDVMTALRGVVDEVVCVEARLMHWAIGLSYSEFPSLDDQTVCALLERAAAERTATT